MKCEQIHLCEPSYFYENEFVYAIDSHNIPSPTNTINTINTMSKWGIEYLTIEFYRDAKILKEYLLYLKTLIN